MQLIDRSRTEASNSGRNQGVTAWLVWGCLKGRSFFPELADCQSSCKAIKK